jgi:OOP family OmpA-OmpF porin
LLLSSKWRGPVRATRLENLANLASADHNFVPAWSPVFNIHFRRENMGKLGLSFRLAGLLLAVGVASPVVAQDAHWYVGGTIGQSKVKDNSFCAGATSCDTKDTAWRVLGGYQINRNFSAEVGYHNLGESKASNATASVNFKANVWELVGIGAWPLGNQFSIYGKAGAYRGEVKASASLTGVGSGSLKETNTDLTYGVGAQYDINRQLGIRAEWQRYTSMGNNATIGKSDVDVMSIGALWRF